MPLNGEPPETAPNLRNRWCRIVFTLIFCSLFYAFRSGVLAHQLRAPVLSYLYLDPIFWIAWMTGTTHGITSSLYIAMIFDGLLFLSCILTILFPSRRLFPAVFFFLYLMYFIIFNTYGGHHTLNKVGILLLPLAFVVKPERFTYLWEGLRYYTLFIFCCAFTWKLVRLSWLNPDQGVAILKKNLSGYMYFHPGTFLTQTYYQLIEHQWVLQLLFLGGFLLEGCFITGFFTRKYDRMLLLCMFLLVAGFWFLADAFFAELLIFGLTLIPTDYFRSSFSGRSPTTGKFPNFSA